MIKKYSHFIFILLLLLCNATYAFAQTNTAKIDFGSIEGSVYRNNYFGLKLTIPEKWHVQDDETKKKMMALGKQTIVSNDEKFNQGVDASILRTLNLLIVYKYPLSSGVVSNPSVALMAENLNQFPNMTSRAYVFSMKNVMQKSVIPYKFEPEIYSRLIGGKEFTVLPTQVTLNGVLSQQNYYVTIMKGYSLAFIITSSANEDAKALEGILSSVKFKG